MGHQVIVEFAFPADVWEVIPRDFPTVDGVTEQIWLDRLTEAYVAAVGEQDGSTREIIRALANGVRKQVSPLDVATVLFRPTSLPVTAVVHIQLFVNDGADAGVALATGLVPEIPMAIPPVITPVSNDELGEGTKAAFIAVEPFPDGTAKGGLSYVFSAQGHVVNVQTSPARLDVIGIIEPFLDALVETVRLTEGHVAGIEQI